MDHREEMKAMAQAPVLSVPHPEDVLREMADIGQRARKELEALHIEREEQVAKYAERETILRRVIDITDAAHSTQDQPGNDVESDVEGPQQFKGWSAR
jgi:hypothetical protein